MVCPTLLLFICVLLAACSHPAPLPILGAVPHFALVDQTGGAFDSARLNGRIWVADFMYTTCPGPCPMMSHQMRRIAEASDVLLVSFTVDPETDTPPVLAAYAKHYPVPPGRWWFLTGARAAINDLGLNAFHLNTVDGSLEHSTRFVLVDGRMRIRAYYQTLEDQFRPQLVADIGKLERESHD
ncbi:MAG: SCO family protein [Bryobacteraceae bacterium]|jgi:protein SCO1/2